MLRLVDFRCDVCGTYYEQVVPRERQRSEHCGQPAVKVWISAPGLAYKPHFSHALNRKVETYREEEKELAKTGSWIATKAEANKAYDTDHFTSDVYIKREKEKIRKVAEKNALKLVRDGVISFRQ